MEKLSTPQQLLKLGVQYPVIYMVKPSEVAKVPAGTPFIVSSKRHADDQLVWLNLLMPLLRKQYRYINWWKVYKQLTGRDYEVVKFHLWEEPEDETEDGNTYKRSDASESGSEWSIESCLGKEGEVSVDILAELKLLPKFMSDVCEAIRVNLSQLYSWNEGYNKKQGLCSGYMEPAKGGKNLMIIDISSSIPRGVSASLLMLMKTMVEVSHADLIVTASESKFFYNEDVPSIDINQLAKMGRNNEGYEFTGILAKLDLDAYESVIAFGDSDWPGELCSYDITGSCSISTFHSFWVTSSYDRYGRQADKGVGYGRWVKELNPNVEQVDHVGWSNIFYE